MRRRPGRGVPPVSRRRVAAGLAGLLVGAGLLAGDRIADVHWLLLLGAAWLALLVAIWPRLRPGADPTARATVETATVFAACFAALLVQLLRTMVVNRAAIAARVGVDPETGEVLTNPRLVARALATERGRILDRNGAVLAESVPDGDGFRRLVADPALALVVGYFSPLLYGTAGLERAYDGELSGQAGPGAGERALADLLGRPPRGLSLRLSLDLRLQRLAADLLTGRPGGAVLLDATTGATLALASVPTFDPNRLAGSDAAGLAEARTAWRAWTADPAAPLVPRPTSGLYPPGSTFKLVTAAAAIEAGIAGPDTRYADDGALEIAGRTIPEFNRPDESRTIWTLEEALGWSLNVVFAQVGIQLGAAALTEAATAWGFGAPLPYDLPTAASRLATDPDFLDAPIALAETAFGQGQLQATPLQMALVAAGIANGGAVMRPWLVAAMENADGRPVWRREPSVWRRPVRPETAATLAGMMAWAVTDGGVRAAAIPGVPVGGKTGTAEAGAGQPPHAWFAGFAGDPPRYAVAVVLDHAGGGGTNALPVGRDLLVAALNGPAGWHVGTSARRRVGG